MTDNMNVLSVANAGKRRYGDNHWFWATWIGLDATPDRDWNQIEPHASGFCPSRKEARRAAWAAIKSRVSGSPSAYQRSWAYKVLWDKRDRDDHPRFSRCKVGKDKWLWVVYKSQTLFYEDEPIANGYASSPELAHDQAVQHVGTVAHSSNMMAEHWRRKQAAIKRSKRRATTSGTTAVECAYECHTYYSDYDNERHESITAHRIVKRTKKRIYVESEEYHEGRTTSGDWRDFVVKTIILDRSEFEATGKARGGGRWYDTFYADPAIFHAERRSTAHRPACFEGLGVPAGATAAEIQFAYRRLARTTHPDVGGDAEAFKQVHNWYEEAMMLASVA